MKKNIKKNEPLHLQSYKIIKDHITQGEFSPGERITESGLSKDLGVSRGTIRETIKMLIQDGLIIHEGGCLRIFLPTLTMATDLYLCRERLESLAAKLATRNITDEEKRKLESILRKADKALSEGNIIELGRLNTSFHQLIVTCSRNNELLQLINVIRAKVAFIRNSLHRNYVRGDSHIQEHKDIAQAIFNNDEHKAEELMSYHIKKDLEAIHVLFSKE